MKSLDLNKENKLTQTETNEAMEMNEVINASEVTLDAPYEEINDNESTDVVLGNLAPEVIDESVIDENVVEENIVEENIVEENVIEENVLNELPQVIKSAKTDYTTSQKPELIEVLRLLIDKDVDAVKNEVEYIKQLFYKKTKLEIEEQKKQFIDSGGLEEEFIVAKDPLEEAFKLLLNQFRGKKALFMAKQDNEKSTNLIEKQKLLEQMKVLVDSSDDVSTHINEFRGFQQKWKTIGPVPQTASTDLWKQFNLYQESFWDLIKINNELREYDFKKNLESKTLLCEAAEKLAQDEDVLSAFQQLQKLHEEWHELGPVAREIREEIWNRFKDASTAINKKHQAYFDIIRKQEEENSELKIALIDKIEAFDFSALSSYRAWDDATKSFLAWQSEWKGIGFAPRKINQKIYDRYRKACDRFFLAKNEFFKETKNVLNQNSEKKKELCEKAESLKDSKEWKETTDKLIQLQKEWKTVGPVAKRYSDELWKHVITFLNRKI